MSVDRHKRASRTILSLIHTHEDQMSSPFWSSPLRYLRWASHERPNVFYSLIIGAMGPITLLTVPPIRRSMGIVRAEAVPLNYPCE